MLKELDELPKELRSWFSSDSVVEHTRELNKQFGFRGEGARVIPYLLAQLIFRGIRPQDFVKELGVLLGVSENSAKSLTKDIELSILEPVKEPLKNWGVDISLIQLTPTFTSQKPIVAPPPPPLSPSIAYEPPPPPAIGGRFEIGGAGSGVSGGVTERVGRIHKIGDAHEHTGKENLESGMEDLEDKTGVPGPRESVLSRGKSVLGEKKKIKLPLPPWQEAEAPTNNKGEEGEPFMLHKETAFTPVLKSQEWHVPTKPALSQPTTDNLEPTIKKWPEQGMAKVFPKPGPQPAPPPEKKEGSLMPPPKLKVVHYDEETTPLGATDTKQLTPNLKTGKAVTAPMPQHNKNQELMRPVTPPALPKAPGPSIKGNTVDLR